MSRRPVRAILVGAGVAVGAIALAFPAAGQTGGGTTTTAPGGGTVHAAAACSATDAASYVTAVTTTASGGGCSDGAGNQVVNILNSFTLAGTQGSYTNPQPFILNGNGFTINANGASRILVTANAAVTTINNLTLTGGIDGGGRGAAVRTSGPLAINGSTFSNNTASNGGGAVSVDAGTITITNSQFQGNKTTGDDGGAIREHGLRGGTAPAITITGSTFLNNSSTVGSGGAIFSDGPVSLVNSTVTGNSVAGGAGQGGGISARGVSVAYTDVFKNTAAVPANGSDIFIRSGATTTTLNAFGSVIWGSACAYQGTPTGTSTGYNYLQDASCFPGGAAPPNATDKVSTTDPGLGAAANNGGPTLTLAPAAGSPLIDGVPAGACRTPPLAVGVTTDQRGLPRPDSLSPACDVGAFEVQPPPPMIVIQPRFTG